MSCTSKWRCPIVRSAAFTDDGERLDEQVVQVLSLLEPFFELDRLPSEVLIGESLGLGLEPVDERHDSRQVLDLLAFAHAKDFREQTHDGSF